MLFNSLTYAKFFAVVFVVSWGLSRWRNLRLAFLMVASYYFYSGWNPKFVPLIFIASTVDYLLATALGKAESPRVRKLLLVGTIVMNLGLLGVFKYWNFGMESIGWVVTKLGGHMPAVNLEVSLPLGISFFTFMSLSYVIDVYRREIEPARNYLHYLTYIAFFPHLVAGPIIRGKDLLPAFLKPVHLSAAVAGEALFLIGSGLIKKVVIGDYLALNLVDRVFESPASYSSIEVLSAMYGYAVQVYCDFSGYSDIAIGSALLLGYRFKLNFDAPFKATNIVEFWRRWHISLSSWLRDYVYIPLGGGRHGKFRKYFNIFLTMVICGLWHGAAWSYVLFGVIQGTALACTHWFQDWRNQHRKVPNESSSFGVGTILGVAATFTFVAMTFTFFRADSITKALAMFGRLATLTTFHPNLHRSVVMIILGALVMQWTPRNITSKAREWFVNAPAPAQALAVFVMALVLREASATEAVPFVYFQF
jgi:alginate O-acetyltransferase complex protein AlgI